MEKRTVTRELLRDSVYVAVGALSRSQASNLVDQVFEEIGDALARGESVKLKRLGSFKLSEKAARIGRNPRTQVSATISPRRVVSYKASETLLRLMNEEGANG